MRTDARWLAKAAATIAVMAVAGEVHAAPVMDDPTLTVTKLVGGLSVPTSMAFLGSNDILVLEKTTGRVRRVLSGALEPSPVLDVNVSTSSERGLLGIAVNGETPPKVFLYYTEAQGADGGSPLGNRVYRYTWNGTSLVSPQLILDLPVLPGPNHDGGVILLGPPEAGLSGDGRPLYVVIGDLNRNGQLQNRPAGPAPDDTSVILRLEQNGSAHPLNPFFGYCAATTSSTCADGSDCSGGESCVTAVTRYFAYGVRNSFGLALDPVTGSLWDTENGPDVFDELNRVVPGFNSGWNQIMGPDAADPQGQADLFAMPGGASTYADPAFSWRDTIAPTGLAFPTGGALGAAYDASVLVGDVNLGNLYRLPLSGARTDVDLSGFAPLQDRIADDQTEANLLRIGSGFGGITDVKMGPDGAAYVVSIGDGAIYRITRIQPTPTPRPPPRPRATLTPGATPTPRPKPQPRASRTPTTTPATPVMTPTPMPTPKPPRT